MKHEYRLNKNLNAYPQVHEGVLTEGKCGVRRVACASNRLRLQDNYCLRQMCGNRECFLCNARRLFAYHGCYAGWDVMYHPTTHVTNICAHEICTYIWVIIHANCMLSTCSRRLCTYTRFSSFCCSNNVHDNCATKWTWVQTHKHLYRNLSCCSIYRWINSLNWDIDWQMSAV